MQLPRLWRIAWLAAVLSLALPALQATQPKTVTVTLRGEITPAMIPKVREAVAAATGDPIPAGLIVLLDSGGGDGLAAVEIGRLLRGAQAHVFVTGRCASACVFVFMGGVVRQAADGALGIHRARLTRIDPATGKRVEIDVGRDDRAARRLRNANASLRQYLTEMGALQSFHALMESTPVEPLRYLSRAEAKSLGVIGFEQNYLRYRDAKLVKRFAMRSGDLERLTDRVLDKCREELLAAQSNFVRCYRLALSGP
jgi:membrane-bound ClpP family serine protease